MAGGCKERGPLISTVDCDSVAVVHALVSSPSLSSRSTKIQQEKREQENKRKENNKNNNKKKKKKKAALLCRYICT